MLFLWYSMERVNLQMYTSKPHPLWYSRHMKPFRSLLIIFCALIYVESISIKSIKMATSKIAHHWSNKILTTRYLGASGNARLASLVHYVVKLGDKFLKCPNTSGMQEGLSKNTHLPPFLAAQNSRKWRMESENHVWEARY